MSLEAIQLVTQAETEAKQRKIQAAADAKKVVANAELAGKQALQRACTQAEAEAKELMAQAEKRSAARAVEIAAQSKQDCAALCSVAESRLEEAAALIVRRVVSN